MNLVHAEGKLGFVYHWECIDTKGNTKWRMTTHNLIPDVGRDYLLNAGLNGGAQYNTWYIGIYEANRVPVVSDTMATLIADCQESQAYTSPGNLRLTLVDDALSNGVWSNATTPAEFAFTAAKSIYGGFLSSNSAQLNTTGLLLSAVHNGTAKSVLAGEILRVTAGLSLTTV